MNRPISEVPIKLVLAQAALVVLAALPASGREVASTAAAVRPCNPGETSSSTPGPTLLQYRGDAIAHSKIVRTRGGELCRLERTIELDSAAMERATRAPSSIIGIPEQALRPRVAVPRTNRERTRTSSEEQLAASLFAPRGTAVRHQLNKTAIHAATSAGDIAVLREHLVFGKDDRTLVADTQAFPFNTVAFVVSTFPDTSQVAYSGVVISPFVVLTAGEALYEPNRGGFAVSVEVFPGQYEVGNDILTPFGSRFGQEIQVPNEWFDTLAPSADFGAVLLENAFPKLDEFMTVVLEAPPIGDFNLAGYDVSPKGISESFSMWTRSGPAVDITNDFFFHRLDEDEGAIGAPAWQFFSNTGERWLFGLECCLATDNSANAGLLFRDSHEALFLDWFSFLPYDPEQLEPLELAGRFVVRARWHKDDEAGTGHPVKLTANTGYFWFFTDDNVEVIIKVLNACSFANRIWVFAGALTNVEVILEVEDTKNGTIVQYFNAQENAFQPIQDTDAFATCP